MEQDFALAEQKHKEFVEKVVASEKVWGLINEEGFATASSNEYEDADVIPFWSEKEGALAAAKDEWKEFTVEEVSLTEFLENWCVGMQNEDMIVGTNWDENLFGTELEPFDLALEVIDELRCQDKTLELTKYGSLQELEDQINDVWEEQEE